jgi:hypothetical protein
LLDVRATPPSFEPFVFLKRAVVSGAKMIGIASPGAAETKLP